VLAELSLSAEDLANEDTALRLGEIFAARQYGYIEFLQDSPDSTPRISVRMVDTETTKVPTRFLDKVEEDADLDALVEAVVAKLVEGIRGSETLQGLVAG